MPDIEIRALRTDEELQSFFLTLEDAFAWRRASPENLERWSRLTEKERSFACFEEDRIVGTSGAFSFDMSVPGGTVGCAGVTMVGVLPTHRRRGLLSGMMRRLLDQAHERGEPTAALWASEDAIYQRFGFGIASLHALMDVERDRAALRDRSQAVGRVRIVDEDESLKSFPSLYEEVRAWTPGMMSRTEDWWRLNTLKEDPDDAKTWGRLFRIVWEQEGQARGYALYHNKGKWDEQFPAGKLMVTELVATSPIAARELWRYLLGIDLVKTISTFGERSDSALPLMLEQPRRARLKLNDALWLRVVDVKSALEARAYSQEGSIVLEVVDPVCEWNQGRWKLEVRGSSASVDPTDEAVELALGIEELSSIYLGGFRFAHLHRAGRIDERSEGAVARADGLFHWNVAPWCPEIF